MIEHSKFETLESELQLLHYQIVCRNILKYNNVFEIKHTHSHTGIGYCFVRLVI